MTRKQALAELEKLREGGLIHGEAFDMAIAALREPVLDENGLVRCGCGYEPELRFDELGWYEVYCTGCDMHGGNSHIPDNVIEEWNTAMGVNGADE